MNKYNSYKPSGIDWIGDIPEHWILSRIGRHYFLERGRVISKEEIIDNQGEYPVYSSQTENNGVLGSINTFDFEGEYVTWTTDGANAGTCFHRTGKFNTTNVCGLLSNKENGYSNLKYLNYLLNLGTKGYVRLDINPKLMNNMMGDIPVIFPSIFEQNQIVIFLDEKTEIIDKLISTKEKKIELLKEQRTSLINQVITKGLDPNVKMKDSGIEWIGEIPEHWETRKLKSVSDYITEKGIPSSSDVRISPENVEQGTGVCLNLYSEYDNEGFKFQRGDILFNKLRVYLSKVILTSYEGYSMGEMIVVRPRKINNQFLFHIMLSYGFINSCNSFNIGVKLPRVSPEVIFNSVVPIPPIKEQNRIVEIINENFQETSNIISLEKRKIDLLKEYRQSLISEVVTGKIDVRNNVN
ncbi:MAG TPA: restriction endonuclease subunit S [Caldisericia bacterium]|jgi:type I restriction enzyme S subunit|nr:restriction endonuclease subunit S [Caldisericia bacterium]